MLAKIVHGPDTIIAGIRIPPQDVGFPVSVEVTYASDVPNGVGSADEPPHMLAEIVHGPDAKIAGIGIPPQDVGFPIEVEVTDASDVPKQC